MGLKAASASGRELLGAGASLAVDRFRKRLLGSLPLAEGRGRWALDVGCGDGLEAAELIRLGWNVEAVDLEPHPRWAALRAAYGARIRFGVASDKELAGRRKRYAMVFQKDVLHHVTDPAALLRTLARLTAPGGDLWILECNRRNPVSYLHLTLLRGHQHFTAARLRALALEAGLADFEERTCEARVWPVESAGFQDLIDGVQDALEALPLWRHVAVYNLMRWRKPVGQSLGSKA